MWISHCMRFSRKISIWFQLMLAPFDFNFYFIFCFEKWRKFLGRVSENVNAHNQFIVLCGLLLFYNIVYSLNWLLSTVFCCYFFILSMYLLSHSHSHEWLHFCAIVFFMRSFFSLCFFFYCLNYPIVFLFGSDSFSFLFVLFVKAVYFPSLDLVFACIGSYIDRYFP